MIVCSPPLPVAAITDLGTVQMFLNTFTDWKSLGLQLGLHYPTLETISRTERGDVVQCKLEMLAAWLRQQDDVSQAGVPSWSVLQKALRSLGQKGLAESMHDKT